MSKGLNGTENGRTRVFIYGALVSIVAIAVVGVVYVQEQAISILGFCGLAVTGLFTHLSSVRNSEKLAEEQDKKLDAVAEKADVAANKVEEVKTTLVKADAKNDAKLDVIHTLVNSGRGVTLKLNAELSRWKADQGDNADHISAAEYAEQMYAEHQVQQAAVDAEAATDKQAAAVKADTRQVEVTNLPKVQQVEIVERKTNP